MMLGKCSNTKKPAFQPLLTIIFLFISMNASSCSCDIFGPPVNRHAVASQLKFSKLESDAVKGIVIYNIKNDAKEAATNIQLRYTNTSHEGAAKTVVINNKLTDTINVKTIPARGSTGDQTLPIDFKLAAEATFNFQILCNDILHITSEPKTFYDKLPQLKLVTFGPTSLAGYDGKIEFKIQKEANSGNIDLSKLSLKVLYTSKGSRISDTKSIKYISGNELQSAIEGGNINVPLSHLNSLNLTQALLIVQLEYGDTQLDKAEYSWSMVLDDTITKIFMAAIQQDEEWMKELLKIPGIDINIKNGQGKTVLHEAVELGNQERVGFLLKFENINVNSKDKDQQTPLHKAVRYGNQEIIASLLTKGADTNAKDNLENTPLHIAAIEGNEETIQKLLSNSNININAKNRSGDTPFHIAIENKKLAAVQTFLQFGGMDMNVVNRNSNTTLGIAARNGDVAIMNILLNNHAPIRIDKDGNTLLHQAVQSGVKDAIQLLLDRKEIDVNAKNTYQSTPLSIAIRNADLEIIKLLLNQPEILIDNDISDTGATKLHMCAARVSSFNKVGEAAAAMEALINKGANVNAKSTIGNTPLHMVAKYGGRQADINILLNYGAEINNKNKQDATPLHMAIDSGNEAAVEALLSSTEIDLNIQDVDGLTPLYKAVLKLNNGEGDLAHEKKIVGMLLEKGAKTDIKNKVGKTVLDLVRELENPEIQQLFGIGS
jgi:cytohesin